NARPLTARPAASWMFSPFPSLCAQATPHWVQNPRAIRVVRGPWTNPRYSRRIHQTADWSCTNRRKLREESLRFATALYNALSYISGADVRHFSLGDWGSGVQISPLRPIKSIT